MAKKSKSGGFFESPLMRSRIKSPEVKLFPEAGLGYLVGPLLALLSNGVIQTWLIQYWDNVLGVGTWGPLFEVLLQLFSAALIVVGNLFVGRLLEKKPSLAGKARPLILIGMPVIAVALLLLFLIPFPKAALEIDPVAGSGTVLASIFIAVGYNLYFAVAWPLYYTSHSALVNLSTRDSGKRGLLSTCIMAAQLGATGIAGMVGPILAPVIGFLPTYVYTDPYKLANGMDMENKVASNDFRQVSHLIKDVDYTIEISREQANSKWTILMIIMIVALIAGCLIEYFFTRERITEEQVVVQAENNTPGKEAKSVSMSEQIKICTKDKYWWIIIIFFFLYQFGGCMKNIDLTFYSQAMTPTHDVSLSGLINIIGALPTAFGMVIVWPIAAKIGKSKTISFGGILALVGAGIAFIALNPALNQEILLSFLGTKITASGLLAVISFIVKAFGTAPAMYISLSVMALVLDHQEAVYGVRTDGFTMAVYGSIMVGMSGICNAIIAGLNAIIIDESARQVLHTILAFGVEGICYIVMAAMFFFMNVEKFTKIDNKAISMDQKAAVEAEGGTYVESEERMKLEKEQAAKEAKMSPKALAKYKEKEAAALEEFNALRILNKKDPVKL